MVVALSKAFFHALQIFGRFCHFIGLSRLTDPQNYTQQSKQVIGGALRFYNILYITDNWNKPCLK